MSKRILIVDDSPMIHGILRKALEGNGFTVCGDATNGKEAVEQYVKLKPDIVFMDITMPIADGIYGLKEIIKADGNAKVIMLSAMGDEEIVQEAMSCGAKVFLKKPFNDYKIISAISKIEA